MSELILFNKPYGVLSQFTDDSNRQTLADFITQKGFYSDYFTLFFASLATSAKERWIQSSMAIPVK